MLQRETQGGKHAASKSGIVSTQRSRFTRHDSKLSEKHHKRDKAAAAAAAPANHDWADFGAFPAAAAPAPAPVAARKLANKSAADSSSDSSSDDDAPVPRIITERP